MIGGADCLAEPLQTNDTWTLMGKRAQHTLKRDDGFQLSFLLLHLVKILEKAYYPVMPMLLPAVTVSGRDLQTGKSVCE